MTLCIVTKHDLKELELKINAQLLLLKWMMAVILAGIVSLIIKAFFGNVVSTEVNLCQKNKN